MTTLSATQYDPMACGSIVPCKAAAPARWYSPARPTQRRPRVWVYVPVFADLFGCDIPAGAFVSMGPVPGMPRAGGRSGQFRWVYYSDGTFAGMVCRGSLQTPTPEQRRAFKAGATNALK